MTPTPPPSALRRLPIQRRRRPVPILPAITLAFGLAIGFLTTLSLTPSREQVLERHLKDRQSAIAIRLAAAQAHDCPESKISAATIDAIEYCHSRAWNTESMERLTSFLKRVQKLSPAAGEIAAHSKQIPPAAYQRLLTTLTEAALADLRIDLALSIVEQSLNTAEPDIDTTRQAIKTFQLNNLPERAYTLIENLAEKEDPLPEDLQDFRIQLARQTNRPAKAFSLLKEKIDSTSRPDQLDSLVRSAFVTATKADIKHQLVPILEKYLNAYAFLDPQSEAADLPALKNEALEHYTFQLAGVYESNGHPESAFDNYLFLAHRGHRESLDRCLALNPRLYRITDLPDAPKLRNEIAREYLSRNQVLSALRALQNPALKSNSEAVALAIYAAHLSRSPQSLFSFFGDNLESRIALPPNSRLQLAELYHLAGRSPQSRHLFNEIIDETGAPHLHARAHFHLGNLTLALTRQNEHLERCPPLSDDYRFLGDIYTRLGEHARAQRAYEKAANLDCSPPGTSRLSTAAPQP